MPLFADAAATDAGWVLGGLSMILTAVFGYLNNRLKIETDSKIGELQSDLKECKEKHGESERQHMETAAKVAALESSRDTERTAKHAAVNQKAVLSYRLAFVEQWLRQNHPELKFPVYVATDDTGDHKPLPPG